MFRCLWWQHPSLNQNKGPGTEAHFWNPPPSFARRPCHPPPCKAIFGPPSPGGATTTSPDATPPQLSVKTCGGGGVPQEGGGGEYWQRGRGGGLRATHYYHMHTSRGCLRAWGYRGMYAIIAISCLCHEESLRVLRTEGIVPLSTKHGTTNLAPLAPWPPHRYLSKLRGGWGAGGCRIKGPGPAAPQGRKHQAPRWDSRAHLSSSSSSSRVLDGDHLPVVSAAPCTHKFACTGCLPSC